MYKTVLALAVTLAVAAPTAVAKGTGWYVGASAGVGNGSIKDDTINQIAASAGISPAGVTKDKSSAAFKVFVGYSMNEYLGLEGGLFQLGSRNAQILDANTGGVLEATTRTWGANLDVVATLPLGGWRFFARGGGYYGRSGLTFASDTGAPTPASVDKYRFNWKAGAGVGYDFASNVGFRAEWERYRVDIGTGDQMYVDTFTGSVLYRF
jgi:opacity protein-like surface antigen